MATKSEAIAYLKQNYTHEDMGDDTLKLVLESSDTDRSQLVWAFVYDHVISLASPFAKIGQITDSQALRSESNFVGVDILGDFYVLRHLILLENVDENEIVENISYLAQSADNREAGLGLGDAL